MSRNLNCCYAFILLTILQSIGYDGIAQRQNLLLESTFEGSNYLGGWANYQHCCDYSVQQSQQRVRTGLQSLRLEIRNDDPQTSGSIRSEITRENDPMNEDRWYGFSLLLENWDDDDAGEHVFQWHPGNDTGTASMSLWTTGGRLSFVTNAGGTAPNQYVDIGPVVSNQWIDFVIHVRWASDTTGLLQVWMKGQQVISRLNVRTSLDRPYFKMGINKFGWGVQPSTATRRVLYFDEVRIGNGNATYNDVAPFLPRRDYFQRL